jgi:hypothetical protein
MLGRNGSEPSLFQMVDLESLVPANHQLRKIDAVLDLSFVPETVAECYSANRGRGESDWGSIRAGGIGDADQQQIQPICRMVYRLYHRSAER